MVVVGIRNFKREKEMRKIKMTCFYWHFCHNASLWLSLPLSLDTRFLFSFFELCGWCDPKSIVSVSMKE